MQVDVAAVMVEDNVTLEQEYEMPPNGEPTRAKDTVPIKPFMASTLRTSLPTELAATVIVAEVGVRLKSACAVAEDQVIWNDRSPVDGTFEKPRQ